MRAVDAAAGALDIRPRIRDAVGFFSVAGLGYASLLLPPGPSDWTGVLVSLALVCVVGLLTLVSVRRPAYSWTDYAAVWLALVAFVPLRAATGGAVSALTPIIFLPLCWAALFLRPRALAVAIGIAVADFVVPLIVVGSAEPSTAWRQALVWCCMALVLIPTASRLVSRLKIANAEREASEARWRAVTDHLPDLTVMVLDEDTTIELVSGGGAMRQGMVQHVGHRLSEVSQHGPALASLVTETSAGHETTVELISTAVGEEHDVVLTPLPVLAGHTKARVLLLARNVSVARARERELVAARDAAEQLFTRSPQPLALLDGSGMLARVNSAFTDLFEITSTEAVGRRLADLDENRTDETLSKLVTVGRGQAAQAIGEWEVHRNGSTLHLAVSGTLLAGDSSDAEHRVLVTLVDLSERRAHERVLTHLADHDPLTALVNRRRFHADLSGYLAQATDDGALLLLDLDNFKQVNDTLGHAAGDQLIVAVAKLLQRHVRGTDVVARLGGDEFAVLLPSTDREGAEQVALSIVQSIRSYTAGLAGSTSHVSISVGVVMLDGSSHDVDALIADADLAMYNAKQAGRSRYVVLNTERRRGSREAAAS